MDPLNLNINPETLAILTFFGIGLAELVHRIYSKDWEIVTKILVCTAGLSLLALGIDGVSVLAGAAVGLNASGIITAVSFIGKKAGQTKEPVVG